MNPQPRNSAESRKTSAAYQHCEAITRGEAKNFSYGIRLLPAPKRKALSAVYAFARRIDDIGDGDAPVERKRELLKAARTDVDRVLAATTGGAASAIDDPVLVALADAASRMPIPLTAFGELIEGCEADVDGRCYRTFDDLVYYCRCVAGSIGRLSLGVFGSKDPERASVFADQLGVALQLTNILRDVREDRRNGRIYLPAEELDAFGVRLELTDGGELGDAPSSLARLVRFQAERAQRWYADGLRLLPLIDRRSAACAGAMAGIYQRLLIQIARRPHQAMLSRMSLPAWQKAAVAARALSGVAP